MFNLHLHSMGGELGSSVAVLSQAYEAERCGAQQL